MHQQYLEEGIYQNSTYNKVTYMYVHMYLLYRVYDQ